MSGVPSPDGQGGADGPDAPPPILGSWARAYAVIVLELAVTVLVLYALARWAA